MRVQTVLFASDLSEIEKSLASLERATEIGRSLGYLTYDEVAYVDSSADPVLREGDLEVLRAAFPSLSTITYRHFGANLGSAGGQNCLLDGCKTDLVLFTNPDVRFSPTAFAELIRPLRSPGVGATEGRQLPLEHPKYYDPETGETSWAAGACMMTPVSVAKALDGFDAKSFFLYCDDVDLSWRIRLQGLKVIHQPSAGAFHDRRLRADGALIPSDVEEFFSAEAYLILAHKYGRADLVKRCLREYGTARNINYRRAAEAYRQRENEGRLPRSLGRSPVADFVGANFALHRFAL